MAKANSRETAALRRALNALPKGETEIAQQIQSRLEGTHIRTAQEIWKLVTQACRAEAALVKGGDKDSLLQLQEFTRAIATTQGLLLAFQRHPKIGGRNGVATALELSRHGVYVRLAAMGLEPNDMNSGNATIASLVQKSPFLKERTEQASKILESL